MKRIRRCSFTLLEVCAALMILAGAITVTMYVLSGSAWRIQRAERFRTENHRLANAVEFFMLYPPERDIEQKFFPYPDMRAICSYEDADLPDGMEKIIDNMQLKKMTMELVDQQGKNIISVSMDRIVEAVQ